MALLLLNTDKALSICLFFLCDKTRSIILVKTQKLILNHTFWPVKLNPDTIEMFKTV